MTDNYDDHQPQSVGVECEHGKLHVCKDCGLVQDPATNPPISPATIDIERILGENMGLDFETKLWTLGEPGFKKLAAHLTDLITEKENRARVDELQRVLIMASTPKTRTSASIRRVIKSWIEYEATLKSKGRDN